MLLIVQGNLVEYVAAPVGIEQSRTLAAARLRQHARLGPVQHLRRRMADQQPVTALAQLYPAGRCRLARLQRLAVDDKGQAGGQLRTQVGQFRQYVVAHLQRTDDFAVLPVHGAQRHDGPAAGAEGVDFQAELFDAVAQYPLQHRSLCGLSVAEALRLLHAQYGDPGVAPE